MKKWDAYVMEKPMCEMGKEGRYREQRGRYFAAQMPSTMREDQGRVGDGATAEMADAIACITSSWSLSSCIGVRLVSVCNGYGRLTLMSSSTQISSNPGCAKYSSKSIKRGIDSCGSFSVLSLLRNS